MPAAGPSSQSLPIINCTLLSFGDSTVCLSACLSVFGLAGITLGLSPAGRTRWRKIKNKKKIVNHPRANNSRQHEYRAGANGEQTYLSQSDRSYAAEAWNTAGSECLQSSIGMDFQQNVRREDEKRWTIFFPCPLVD